MKILTKNHLDEAVEFLKEGKTLVFPTETSYGLGCDATNQEAVDKIFKIKGRRSDKPLLVVVPSVEMAKKYLFWNDLLQGLADKYWPGPLTIVGEYNKGRVSNDATRHDSAESKTLAMGVVAADNTIAVRVTDFPLTKFLSEKLGRPLVATSANLADAGNIYDIKKIKEIFSEKPASRPTAQPFGTAAPSNSAGRPDIIIDGGDLPQNPSTTIVSVINNNLTILRQGQIKIS